MITGVTTRSPISRCTAAPSSPAALEMVERGTEAAELGVRAVLAVEAASTFVVDVFGGVGEQRQPAERPDQVELVVDRPVRERVGQRVERTAPATAGVDGPAAHRLDEVEDLVTSLIADDVAEDPPEQMDVGAERGVLARVGFGGLAIASPDNVGARRSSWDGNLSGVPRFEPFRALRYSPDHRAARRSRRPAVRRAVRRGCREATAPGARTTSSTSTCRRVAPSATRGAARAAAAVDRRRRPRRRRRAVVHGLPDALHRRHGRRARPRRGDRRARGRRRGSRRGASPRAHHAEGVDRSSRPDAGDQGQPLAGVGTVARLRAQRSARRTR